MTKLNRRGFIGAATAAVGLRGAGIAISRAGTRRVLTLVYDKSLGMMRAVEKVVPK